jgi:hypothetical protein
MQPTQDPFAKPADLNANNPFDPNQVQAQTNNIQLVEAYNAAGSNFYSIALFSLINSVINFFEGGIYFPIGLAITQIIDGFSIAFKQELSEYSQAIFIVNLLLDIFIVAIVALFGFFIKKQKTWLIIVGAVLYLLDGLLMLLFTDWIGAAFHAYFLFRIWGSWQAIRNFSKPTIIQSTSPSL